MSDNETGLVDEVAIDDDEPTAAIGIDDEPLEAIAAETEADEQTDPEDEDDQDD
jgi:hypothetical protein